MKTPSVQASNGQDRGAARAMWRRKNHAHIEAMQNLMISAVAEETGLDMPLRARRLLSAIQGAHGGGERRDEEFTRSYLKIADQLAFKGNDEARRSRVRDWVNELDEWQRQTYLLLSVLKGGYKRDEFGRVLKGDDGEPVLEATKFVDHLKPIADDAVMFARDSELWKKHPGDALAAQVGWAVRQLSRHPKYVEPLADEEAEAESPANAEETEEDRINGRLAELARLVKSNEEKELAADKRIREHIVSGELTSVAEIDGRLATLEVHYARARAALEKNYNAARAELLNLRESRCGRMMDFTDPEQVVAEVDDRLKAPKGNAPPPSWLDEALGDAEARVSSSARANGNYRSRDIFDLAEGETDESIVGGG